jgi:hypothetical protein
LSSIPPTQQAHVTANGMSLIEKKRLKWQQEKGYFEELLLVFAPFSIFGFHSK